MTDPESIPCSDGVDNDDRLDAELLLSYAAKTGIMIDRSIVEVVTANTQTSDAGKNGQSERPSASDFYLAYQKLSNCLAPVSAQTLCDTAPGPGKRWSFAGMWAGYLMGITTLFLFLIIGGEVLEKMLVNFHDPDVLTPSVKAWLIVDLILKVLIPFVYGGLGACTFLLVSCHKYLVERSFDRTRRAEYWSRLLLGVIAGGTILLFVEQVIHKDGSNINISSAALAFLAGYNVDFLFMTLERLMQAILPKVDLESVVKEDKRQEATDEKTRIAIKHLVDPTSRG